MGSASRSSSRTTNIPRFARPYVEDLTNRQWEEYRQPNPAAGLFPQSSDLVGRSLAGEFVDPTRNPYIQNVANELVRRQNINLSSNLANIRDQFNRAGLNLSSSSLGAQNQAAVAAQENLIGQLSELFLQNLGRERAIQAGSVEQAQALYGTPLERALATIGALTGTQSRTSQRESPMQVINAALGAVAAGIASCWVAEAIWGNQSPKTHYARFYVSSCDGLPAWALNLYRTRGRHWAKKVKNSLLLRTLITPLFAWFAFLGWRKITRIMNHGKSTA